VLAEFQALLSQFPRRKKLLLVGTICREESSDVALALEHHQEPLKSNSLKGHRFGYFNKQQQYF
jgi:hypothetical protein